MEIMKALKVLDQLREKISKRVKRLNRVIISKEGVNLTNQEMNLAKKLMKLKLRLMN